VRAQEPEPQGDAAVQALVGTAFTFQGRLTKNGTPVDGVTCTFTFALHAAASGGSSLETVSPTAPVSDGYFAVPVDYGVATFEGEARWIEVSVQCPGDASPVALNDERIPLTPAPYAIGLRPGASIEATTSNALNVSTEATAGAALSGQSSATTGNAAGVYGTSASGSGAGVSGINSSTGYGLYGSSDSGYGVYGSSSSSYAVYGTTTNGYGVYGAGGTVSIWAGNAGTGVWGDSSGSYGVHGTSDSAAGVMGQSQSSFGVLGRSSSGYAVFADGDAHVEGDLSWQAKTSYVSVAPAAFIPAWVDESRLPAYENPGYTLENLVDDHVSYVAPILLPHGAVVTEFRVGYRDGSDEAVNAYLRRRSMAEPDLGYTEMASAASVGSPGSVTQDLAIDSSISHATIDNSGFAYYVAVELPPESENCALYGVVVEYTFTEPY
jgi:hypothetical protein